MVGSYRTNNYRRIIMANAVIGQTGSIVLSDSDVKRGSSGGRTLRYQYEKLGRSWMAWICGPLHSRMYGACGFGTTKAQTKKALSRTLANNHGYFGNLIFSDVDDADRGDQVIGRTPTRSSYNLTRRQRVS